MNDTDKTLYGLCLIFIGIAVFSLTLLNLLDINVRTLALPCLFKYVTGLYCPGCGSTRSLYFLLHFNILKALYYNPGFVFMFIFVLLYVVTNTLQLLSKNRLKTGIQYKPVYLIIWLALLLTNCIFKNILLICFSIRTM